MERSLMQRRRPWWMAPFDPEPAGDIWADRLWPEWPRWQGQEYRPTFDLWEKDGIYHLEGDLSGVKKDDISIEVDGNRVTVSGKKEYKEEREGKNYYVKESGSGSFSRSFQLPGEVSKEKVDANFKDGLLHVALPLKKTPGSRKIEIKE